MMLSDMLTNPKQETPFRRLREEVMNYGVNYDDDVECARTHVSLIPEEDLVAWATTEQELTPGV